MPKPKTKPDSDSAPKSEIVFSAVHFIVELEVRNEKGERVDRKVSMQSTVNAAEIPEALRQEFMRRARFAQ